MKLEKVCKDFLDVVIKNSAFTIRMKTITIKEMGRKSQEEAIPEEERPDNEKLASENKDLKWRLRDQERTIKE